MKCQEGIGKYPQDLFRIFNHLPFNLSLFAANREESQDDVRPELIDYYISTRELNFVLLNETLEGINPKLKVKFLVHGWTEHPNVTWCNNATEAYLRKGKFNVIAVNWSKYGDNNYLTASMYSQPVGNVIAEWIVNLHKKKRIPLKNFHLLSHSLGCQVAAFIGKHVQVLTGKKLGRITAMDPAAPIFDLFDVPLRLHATDAKFVDIIHTDGGVLGFKYPIGTVDFFPNGGTSFQPGCNLLKPDVKYEDRKWYFYLAKF